MSLYGFTEFGNETRDKFRDTIFERMDTVFSNWLGGEYDDCELDYIIENDLEVRSMCYIYESLWATFRVGVNYVDKFDWLESRGMSHFPTRASRVVSIDPLIILRNKIYDRMDVVYYEWKNGKYRNKDLRRALENDSMIIALLCRWYEATADDITPDDWAAERQCVDDLDYLNNRTIAPPVALQVAIPVLEPIRQMKRRKVDLEELTPSEEFDLESVALPVEPVVRRSKRVKYARDFYYGY